MKGKQKRAMAKMSFNMRKMQTENLLHQQMNQYQIQLKMAQADGVIDPTEQAILQQTLGQIQQTAGGGGMGNLNSSKDLEALAKELGIDRFRVGPIPLGPKLTLNQIPTSNIGVPAMQTTDNKLNLNPTNNDSLEAQLQEKMA
jgi:hypothetical protein